MALENRSERNRVNSNRSDRWQQFSKYVNRIIIVCFNLSGVFATITWLTALGIREAPEKGGPLDPKMRLQTSEPSHCVTDAGAHA